MILAFSNVQTDYFSRIRHLFNEPVVQVYCLKEIDYRRLSAGGRIGRLRLRVLMYVVYPLMCLWRSFRAGPSDTLIVSSNTFFAPWICAIASRWSRPAVIHWLYDLYPDALEVAGAIPRNGFRARAVGCIQRAMNRLCSGVIYLGPFLRSHGERRWGPSRRSISIDVAADESVFAPPSLSADREIVVHYGGQLGWMHDAESLAACMSAASESVVGFRFDLRVSGAHRESLSRALAPYQIRVDGPVSSDAWRNLVREFSIGLVSLSPGGATVCLPSKTYAMMAGGLAIIAICPAWSDLARLVTESQCGLVVNNSPYVDVAALEGPDYLARCYEKRPQAEIVREFVDALLRLLREPALLKQMRENAVAAAHGQYGSDALRGRWAEVLTWS